MVFSKVKCEHFEQFGTDILKYSQKFKHEGIISHISMNLSHD